MSNPCPQGNGTTIGTVQEFTLQCESNLRGETISSEDADSFLECVDLCANFHPRCEGVVFNRRTCDLKADIRKDDESRRFDAAVAQFPIATSNCDSLGARSEAGSRNFDMFCGSIIEENDLSQDFAPTFVDCMDRCASTGGCGAVSFDASMDNGFKNCYLKRAGSSALEPSRREGMDTAVLSNSAAVEAQFDPAPTAAPSEIPTVSPSENGKSPHSYVGVQAVADSTPASPPPATVAPASTATLTPLTPLPTTPVLTMLSTTADFGLTSAPMSILTSTVLSVVTTIPAGIMTTPPAASIDPSSSSSSPGPMSNAWIAAPIVGSVAAVTAVAVAFVLWGRRHAARPGGDEGLVGRLLSVSGRGSAKAWKGHGGGQFYGHSWRVRHKLADEELDGSRQSSRTGHPAVLAPARGAARSATRGSPMDGIPAFLRQ